MQTNSESVHSSSLCPIKEGHQEAVKLLKVLELETEINSKSTKNLPPVLTRESVPVFKKG